MALPIPEPGLVIYFNYLWRREQDQGRDNARYPRPCAIVVAHRRATDDRTIVLVVPITHSMPTSDTQALELPSTVKQQLGLDNARSWIVVNEVNEFVWPGYDVAKNAKGHVAYGHLPPKLYNRVRDLVARAARAGDLGRIPR